MTTPLELADNGADSRVKINNNFTEIENAIEAIVVAGAPLATTTVKGRVKLSVAPVDADEPTAVGDNDPRLPDGDLQDALAGGDDFGTPSGSNKFVTEDLLGTGLSQVYTISGSPHTWTKPANAKAILVRLWSAGGGGQTGTVGNSQVASGGGGGMFIERLITASLTGPTVTVTVGAGGTANNNGGDTSFGSLLVAKGGKAGNLSNIGGNGAGIFDIVNNPAFGTVGGIGVANSNGLSAEYGGGAGGGSNTAATAGAGGGSIFAGAGGGGGGATIGSAGTQRSGGNGGLTGAYSAGGGAAGGAGVAAVAGNNGANASVAGGGGGGGGAADSGGTPGNGGNGLGGVRMAGGGGGGGGSVRVSGTPGTGGTGGDGYAEIITFF